MFTKHEKVAEERGDTTQREVFSMPSEAEAVHYVKELFKAQYNYANERAAKAISLLETKCAKGMGKEAKAVWENRGQLCDLFEIWQVHEAFREYCIDIVQAHFEAKMQALKLLLGGRQS